MKILDVFNWTRGRKWVLAVAEILHAANPPTCMTVWFAYSTRSFLSQEIYVITYAKNTA